MATEKETNKKENKGTLETSASAGMNSGKQKLSIGICILLCAVFAGAFVMSLAKAELRTENILMLLGMFICAGVSIFGLKTLAIVLTGLQIVSFVAYKLYGLLVMSLPMDINSYAWILIPAISMVGMSIFASGMSKLAIENNVLRRQVDELVMIDPLTGLNNLRSIYMDIQAQISYAERNGKSISLMIIKLRYAAEMKKVLSKNQFNSVVKALATVISDTVRLEDKVYSIAPDGVFAIVLTCDKGGTKVVEKRMRSKLETPDWIAGISEKPIRAEVKMGALEYQKEKFHRDANGYIDSVMEEVEYDI